MMKARAAVPGLAVMVEGRYTLGLTDIDETDLGSLKNRVVSNMVGATWGLGGSR